ncbi:MAG TPA: hypothetical protein VFG23_22505 [Polyangia bacterium]|nr:hypothetical protein [Polyangia bacterium]
MSRPSGVFKWASTSTVVAVVVGALILLPALQRPVLAQQSWAPPPAGQPAGQPGYGYGYGPPPVDAGRAAAEGIQDADGDINGTLWFFVGCLGIIGIAVAYFAEPSPPAARLMGKSAEYVMIYSTSYKSEGKSIQGRHAIYGCLVGTAIAVAIYIIIVVAIVKNANSMPVD